jgi:hypothetical protein
MSSSLPSSSPPRSTSVSSMSSSVSIGIVISSRSSDCDPPTKPLMAAGVPRDAGEDRRGVVLFRTVLFRAVLFRAALFRAALFRAPEARLREAPPVLREPVAVRLRPPAALRFRLALRFRPAAPRALLRLADAARLVFFLPRGGILLLRELRSQSAAGEANPLPAFISEIGPRKRQDTYRQSSVMCPWQSRA